MLEFIGSSWIGQIVAIVIGFAALIYGADWLVDGASGIAKRFGVSNLVIGLTVVAFGTSMPEFIVSFLAAMEGNTEIAITNILGSNSINMLVILGCTALIYPIASQRSCRQFDIPMSMIAGVLVILLAWNGSIPRWGGALLLFFFIWFLIRNIRSASNIPDEIDNNATPILTIRKAVALVLIGLAGLVLGGELVVRGATAMAHQLGVSDAIIGLTIVALGTSLPELATSCIAAAKKNCDLALGNVIGSNIFNVFFILGVSATIHPLPAYNGLILDAILVVVGAALVWLFVVATEKHEIKRWHGAILLAVYAIYLAYRIMTLG